MSSSHPKRSLIIFACAGLVLGIAVWTSGRITRKQSTAKKIDVRVQNSTAALKIMSTRKIGEGDVADLEVMVMNQSGKIVLAYTFSSGESGLTSFGLRLEPGGYHTERIPFANLESFAGDGSISDLRLSAVYLEDGSSEGEKINVDRLNNRMLGMQEQAASALDAWSKASSSGETDPERLTKMVEGNLLSTLVTEQSTAIASERLAGRAFINEKISREMKKIRDSKYTSGTKIQDRLGNLIVSVEKLSGAPKKVKKESDK